MASPIPSVALAPYPRYSEDEMQDTYQHLQAQFENGVHAVQLADEQESWAVSRKREGEVR